MINLQFPLFASMIAPVFASVCWRRDFQPDTADRGRGAGGPYNTADIQHHVVVGNSYQMVVSESGAGAERAVFARVPQSAAACRMLPPFLSSSSPVRWWRCLTMPMTSFVGRANQHQRCAKGGADCVFRRVDAAGTPSAMAGDDRRCGSVYRIVWHGVGHY